MTVLKKKAADAQAYRRVPYNGFRDNGCRRPALAFPEERYPFHSPPNIFANAGFKSMLPVELR